MWTPCGRPSAAILTISRFLDRARMSLKRSDGPKDRVMDGETVQCHVVMEQ